MADIQKPNDLILPIPETNKEQDLYKTLIDYTQSLNQTFSDLEDIESITAGDGMTDSSNTFSINVDNSTIEINGSDNLAVKDDGIGTDHISNTLAGLGLGIGGASGALDVNVDDSSIEIDTDVVGVKDVGITSDHLATSSVITAKILDKNVTGTKLEDNLTFNTFPITPSAAPDADYEVANKLYVDTNATSGLTLISNTALTTGTSGNITIADSKMYLVIFKFTVAGDTILSTTLNGDTDVQYCDLGEAINQNTAFNLSGGVSIEGAYADNSTNGRFIISPGFGANDVYIRGEMMFFENSGQTLVRKDIDGYAGVTSTLTSFQIFTDGDNMTGNIYLYEYDLTV